LLNIHHDIMFPMTELPILPVSEFILSFVTSGFKTDLM